MSNPHSEGPWKIANLSPSRGRITIRDASDNVPAVAQVLEARGSQEANARLIAAAPDLLECLKWAATFAEGTRDQQCCGDDLNNPTFNRWIEGCNQAIAKAEGGAS